MPEAKRCPQCQAEIPAQAPEGLCPQCLLQAGLEPKTADAEPKTAAYSPSGSGFVPPTPETLQAAFPQLEILELLGKGGMGAVYKARQRTLDRLVAVKILPPEFSRDPAFVERFLREAKALAMLGHPNIVAIHDIGQAGGYCYFVMEFVDGVNLRQAMLAGNLKAAEALKIVPQICDALQFAHDEGIVHRDIKPENILLDKKGRVKIADFGLAKLLGKTHDVTLTGTQQVMGTLHYMAPEQIEGARDVDHRADIYSLGVTFYEMLTGELPIGRFAAPSKKVQIDVRLDEVVLRSLEKAPEQRYQHASEIKTEVEGIVSTPVAAAVPAPVAEHAQNAYADLPPGKRLLVDYYRTMAGFDLNKAMATVSALDELELAVLENFSNKILSIKAYREKTGASLSDAKVAVEAIAKKHGLEFPHIDWKTNVAAACVALIALAGILVMFGYGAWFYSGLSPIIAIPLVLLLASPLAVSAWKNWGTPAGYRSAFWAGVMLFAPVGIPLVTFLIVPEPTLNWLYALTGTTPGPHDALLVRLIFWGGLLCLLIWLINWLRMLPQRTAKRPPQQRYQQASGIKPGVPAARPLYLRAVAFPFLALCAVWLIAFAVTRFAFEPGEETWLSTALPSLPMEQMWVLVGGALVVLLAFGILNGVWLFRAATVGGYVRRVSFPCIALSAIWLLLGILLADRGVLGGPIHLFAWVASGALVLGLILNAVWLCQTFGIGLVWKYLPFAWTLLCVVLFVMLWTPYATNRAIWSGYLDGSIWPHHEITECAVSLEPKEPTCKRVIIREKAENARSGYEMAHRNAMQPEKDRRIRLTYDIEVQPVKGESRQLVVDALNGMSWTAEERSGSILDAVSLAEWLREGDVGYHEFEEDVRKKIERKERFSPLRGWLKEGEEDSVPVDKEVYRKLLALAKANGIEDPEETRKKRLAAHAMQARTIVDIIQIASRDQFVFYYQGWVGGPRKSRLENATYGWGSQLPRDDAFVRVRGLKATESEKWEPVVPILYVGVPLMLGVWGVGLWLLLRRWRREAS